MFYLTSKFHDNRVNTFGIMPPPPPPPEAQELQKSPGGIGLSTHNALKLCITYNAPQCSFLSCYLLGLKTNINSHAIINTQEEMICVIISYKKDLRIYLITIR